MIELDFLAPAQIQVGTHQQCADVLITESAGEQLDRDDFVHVALLLPVTGTRLGSKERTVLAEENRVRRNEAEISVWLEVVGRAVGIQLDREQNRRIHANR